MYCIEQAGRSKHRKAVVSLDPGESVSAKVVLAKPDSQWAVAASNGGQLFLVQVRQQRRRMKCCL